MGEILPAAEQHLARKSRNAALISLAGFLMVVSTLGYSAWEIRKLEERKTALTSEIDKKREEKEALVKENLALQQQIQTNQERLDRLGLQLATGDVGAAKQTLANQAAANAPLLQAAPPRAYVQLRSRDQRGLYDKLSASLRQAGFRVPDPELVPDKGPQSTQVRYFRQGDRAAAERAAEVLGKWPVGEVKVAYVAGYEDSKLVKPNQIEVWLAPQIR